MDPRFLVGRRSETGPASPYFRNWLSASWTHHDGAEVHSGMDCTWWVSHEPCCPLLSLIGCAHSRGWVERVYAEVFGELKGQILRKMNRGEVSCLDW